MKPEAIPRMIFKMRRLFPVACVLLWIVSASAQAPSKRPGIFGFGRSTEDQISAGLFPGSDVSSGSTLPTAAPAEGIFRGGQPQPVEPVSYKLENGRRVELSAPKPANLSTPVAAPAPLVAAPASPPILAEALNQKDSGKKRGGFFPFGKRDSSEEENVIPALPLPAAVPVASTTQPPVAKPAPVAAPVAAPTTAQPVRTETAVDTPAFVGVENGNRKSEKFGWIPSLNPWKKSEKEDVAAPVPASPPAPAMVAAPIPSKPVASTAAPRETSPAPAKPSPAADPSNAAAPEVATFEIRKPMGEVAEPEKEKKADRDGGLLSPIAKIVPPKKEIDLSSAETIIQDGEILDSTRTHFESSPSGPATGARQAPQVVNGVTTYSSWGDVNARSTSVADRIINQIR